MSEDSTLTTAEKRRRRLIISLQTAPCRVCYTLHYCELCVGEIRHGEVYCDRGHGRRAHYDCVPGLGTCPEPWMHGPEACGRCGHPRDAHKGDRCLYGEPDFECVCEGWAES